ncbi:MAG: GTPase HflX, partial [Clostridia bacterium]|nr:GTPase HflX [Clostridia bacterium]
NTGIDKLLEVIGDVAPGKKKEISVLRPYSEGALVSRLHETQKILSEEYTETGTKIRLLADSTTYNNLKEYITEMS